MQVFFEGGLAKYPHGRMDRINHHFCMAKLSFFLVVSSFTFVLVIVIYLLFHSAEVEFLVLSVYWRVFTMLPSAGKCILRIIVEGSGSMDY